MRKFLARRFHQGEMKKNMAALQALERDVRPVAANDLALTTYLIRNGTEANLDFFLQDAVQSRHAAIARGATGRDASWLVPSINESLLTFAKIDGRNSQSFLSAMASVEKFVEDNLFEDEIDAAHLKAQMYL